jgi:uncharacterized protein (DUF1499 family)
MTRKHMLTTLLIGACLLLAVVAVAVVAQVEDWRRDLTTNYAETGENSPEPRLQPLQSALDPPALAERTQAAVKPLANWSLASQTTEGDIVKLHFVRTTPLMRFKDDIHVRIEPATGGSELNASSRSRVGKGDLGQNPRNLRELLAAVRKASE